MRSVVLPSRPVLLVLAVVTALAGGIGLVVHAPARAETAALPALDPAVVAEATLALDLQAAEIQAAVQQAAVAPHLARQRAYAAQQNAAAKVVLTRARIVEVAKKQIGDRYSAGSTGPHAFDCSGLTRYVYKVATGKELPHQSHAQYARVKKISRGQAKPGDLVFFFRGGAHHVGIYIGNGKMVDAAGYGKGVRVSPISGSWWSRTYTGMGRLLPA